MANRAYLRVWTRDFSEETMIAEFARFLASVPLSEAHAGFDQLTVQAVDATETPIVKWDLWAFDIETLKWQHGPQPLVILCQGKDYDDGAAASEGQLSADLGFEHF